MGRKAQPIHECAACVHAAWNGHALLVSQGRAFRNHGRIQLKFLFFLKSATEVFGRFFSLGQKISSFVSDSKKKKRLKKLKVPTETTRSCLAGMSPVLENPTTTATITPINIIYININIF